MKFVDRPPRWLSFFFVIPALVVGLSSAFTAWFVHALTLSNSITFANVITILTPYGASIASYVVYGALAVAFASLAPSVFVLYRTFGKKKASKTGITLGICALGAFLIASSISVPVAQAAISSTGSSVLSQYSCEKGANFLITVDDATTPKYYGIAASSTSTTPCGTLVYGGPTNAGGASGTSFSSVFNLVSSAIASASGGTMLLTAGTYTLSGILKLGNFVNLAGEGSLASIIKEANSVNLAQMVVFQVAGGTPGQQVSQPSIRDVEFDGNKANNPSGGSCLDAGKTHTLLVFSVDIRNCNKYGIAMNSTTFNARIDEVQIGTVGSNGINMTGNPAAIRVTNTYLNNNGGDGIECSCTESWFINVISDTNSGNGFFVTGATNTISNGWVGGNSKNGILTVGMTDSIIANEEFKLNGRAGGTNPDYYGLRMRGNTSQNVNNLIVNNRFIETYSIGTGMRVEGTATTNIIEGNDFTASTVTTISFAITSIPAGYAGQNIVKDNDGNNPIGKPAGQQYGYQGAGTTWNFQNLQCGSNMLATFNLKAAANGAISATIGIAATSAAEGTDTTYVILIASATAGDIHTVSIVVPNGWYAGPNTVGANTNVGASTVCIDA